LCIQTNARVLLTIMRSNSGLKMDMENKYTVIFLSLEL